MAEGEQSGDRTEAATERHLDQARAQGQASVSREVVTFVSLATVTLLLGYQLQAMMRHLLPSLVVFISRSGEASTLEPAKMRSAFLAILIAIGPILTAAALAGSSAVLLQTRFLVNLSGFRPKVSRVNPAAGLMRIFGLNGLVEMLKSLIKLGLLLTAMWIAVKGDWPGLVHVLREDSRRLLSVCAVPAFHLFVASVTVQGIIAGADLLWVRFRQARDLRMTKQDVRDELKDTEGNVHVKGRIRRIRLSRARNRMMAKVPGATVIVTNPTHYAVALTYDRAKNPAPRIVAKGADMVAARIREVAAANGVPIVANPPLARALYRLDLDTEIPAEHYKAVAEIIAYVWRLRQRGHAVS